MMVFIKRGVIAERLHHRCLGAVVSRIVEEDDGML